MLCFAFGLVAEIELNLIFMRTKEALALRKSEGMDTVVQMLNGNRSIVDICRLYNLSRDTFDKFRRSNPRVQKAIEAKK